MSSISEIIQKQYPKYLLLLRELSSTSSVFTSPSSVESLMASVEKYFFKFLPDYSVVRDAKKNLIVLPKTTDQINHLIYLSAHIDTVGANIAEWDAPFHPFIPYEDEEQLVARGVNDCKAGVALQLFFAFLVSQQMLSMRSVAFAVTFKEEGAGEKSSTEIGRAMGRSLPIGSEQTTFLVLENTVSIKERASLGIYLAERSSFTIEVTGTIVELQALLTKLNSWNPVSIRPECKMDETARCYSQAGGHICSRTRDENLLTKLIEGAAGDDVLQAGEREAFAVVPTHIFHHKHTTPVLHHLVLSNRSFITLDEVTNELEGVGFEALKSFELSSGMDMRGRAFDSLFYKAIQKREAKHGIPSEVTWNTGASDASIVSHALPSELQDSFFPIVMGPGTRSQRNVQPPRLTHGKNETFMKKAGLEAVQYISELLHDVGMIQVI